MSLNRLIVGAIIIAFTNIVYAHEAGNHSTPQEPIAEGLFNIIGESSSRCLSFRTTGPEEGRKLEIYDCKENINYEKFKVIEMEDGYRIQLADWSGFCLAVNLASREDGAPIVLRPCKSEPSQIWAFNRVRPRSLFYSILPIHMLGSGKCLQMSVANGSVGNNSEVTQNYCAGNTNQHWRLIPTSPHGQPPTQQPPVTELPASAQLRDVSTLIYSDAFGRSSWKLKVENRSDREIIGYVCWMDALPPSPWRETCLPMEKTDITFPRKKVLNVPNASAIFRTGINPASSFVAHVRYK